MTHESWVILALFLALAVYVAWRVSRPVQKNEADTQPVVAPEPKPFTPLADALGGLDKFEDKDSLKAPPQFPLPLERALPRVQKRKGKKKP